MANTDVVEIILALRNVAQFVSGSKQASTAIGQVGTEAEKTGQKAKVSWKSLAKWAGGAAAVYGAYRFLKGSVKTTEELTKSALALQRQTKGDIQTSGEWAALAKTRGIQTKQLQMGFTTLSRQIEKTAAGTKKHNSALEQLGISSKNAAVQSGDVNSVLLQVSDRLSKTSNVSKKAALNQQLFGRAGIALQPVLYKGSKAIQEQLDMYGKYIHIGDGTAKSVAEEAQHQRELQAAYMGVQVALGTALLPLMVKLSDIVVQITRFLAPLTKNTDLFAAAVGVLVAAMLAYKLGMVAAAIANIFFQASLGPIVLGVYLVVAALTLLAIGVLLVIKHWDWFKKKAEEVWGWIKANWPLLVAILLGPFAVAGVLIYKNFDKIKTGVIAVFDAIKKAVKAAIDYIVRQFHRVTGLPGQLLNKIPGAGYAKSAFGLFHGQAGGVVPYRSPVLVGERGPEVLSLPGGATVTPLPASPFSAEGMVGPIVVHSQLVVDRRVLAEAVAQHTADKAARR